MNKKTTQLAGFDEGIKLFIKILKAQPGLLQPDAGTSDEKGRKLASMAVAFSLEYQTLRVQNGLA